MPKVKKERKAKPEGGKEREIRSRWWFITMNSRAQDEPPKPMPIDKSTVDYQEWVKHAAPTTGMVHYHCVVHFKDGKTRRQVKLYMRWSYGDFDPQMSHEGAEKYLNDGHATIGGPEKEGNPTFRQGYRTDIETAISKIREGMTPGQVRLEQPKLYRLYKAVDQMKKDVEEEGVNMEPYNDDRAVVVIWGKQNMGKTSRFYGRYGEKNCYVVNLKNKHPWDEYKYQENIIVEDLKTSTHSVDTVKDWITTDIKQVHSRFKEKPACWKRVLITSNFDPATWWPHDQDRGKVMDRIDLIIHVEDRDQPDDKFPPWNPKRKKTEI